jgi:hypothetical protein
LLERQARNILESAKGPGSTPAMAAAGNTLSQAHEKPVSPELSERCYALADQEVRKFLSNLHVCLLLACLKGIKN